jgi:hypothetical protein
VRKRAGDFVEVRHSNQFTDPTKEILGLQRGAAIGNAGMLLMLDPYLKDELVFGVECAKKSYKN